MVKCIWAHDKNIRGLLTGKGKERKHTLQMHNLDGNSSSRRMTMSHYSEVAMKKSYVVVFIRKY